MDIQIKQGDPKQAQEWAQKVRESMASTEEGGKPQKEQQRASTAFPVAPRLFNFDSTEMVRKIRGYGQRKERAAVAQCVALGMHPSVGRYRAEVLAWIDSQP